jgi:hypothetical protein
MEGRAPKPLLLINDAWCLGDEPHEKKLRSRSLIPLSNKPYASFTATSDAEVKFRRRRPAGLVAVSQKKNNFKGPILGRGE